MKPTTLQLRSLLLCCLSVLATSCATKIEKAQSAFIDSMVATHRFNRPELDQLFQSVEIKDDIIKKISTPAEGMPWYKYRKIFMTEARINGGVKFWQENEQVLAAVEKQYGVPAEIIIAIIGVETLYGQHTGKHRVIDALSTLAFAYPPRSKFFVSELENYLLLCRDERLNPLAPTGSYAGAMGIPQFMPSSFRAYAADFDRDNRRDIWHNKSDVIASIANYLARHQWRPGQVIALPVKAVGENYKAVLSKDLKPDLSLASLESFNLKLLDPSAPIPLTTKVKILALEQQQGEELWATLDNFYAITRYNHSPLYAMAVFQLSKAVFNQKLASRYEQSPFSILPVNSNRLFDKTHNNH